MSGNFKGFAMLRQMTLAQPDKLLPGWDTQHKPQPVYVEVSQPAIRPGVSCALRFRLQLLLMDLHTLHET